ncbi:MAG: CRISPR/Cas system CSM-associated protein Csm2 small subunit [Marivirga sp.]|jgi:CRISPR/Cas system CSM-associated protein Csm2 small subunit
MVRYNCISHNNTIYWHKLTKMIAVLTGDIINSKQGEVRQWLPTLKACLAKYGDQPASWEIFRGDSFQLALEPKKALIAALHLKSSIKTSKLHDIRIAIGIGKTDHYAHSITESNGTAYNYSGEAFDLLKKQSLAIRTSNKPWDKKMNLLFKLALLSANQWSPIVAMVIKTAIENSEKSQKEIAQLLGKSQSVISETFKRGGYEEMTELNHYFQQQISSL